MSADTFRVKVLQSFHAFGRDFHPNEVLPLGDLKEWPEGALKRRIENQFLELTTEELQSYVPPTPPAAPAVAEAEAFIKDAGTGAAAVDPETEAKLAAQEKLRAQQAAEADAAAKALAEADAAAKAEAEAAAKAKAEADAKKK